MITLAAQFRQETGRAASRIRRAGFLPAVVYGRNVPSRALRLTLRDFEKAYATAGESGLVTLHIDDGQNKQEINVLIYGVARHPLTDVPIHADFYAVQMDKTVRATIPIEFLGESPAVKNLGGILLRALHEIEVEALPANLPHALAADCSRLAELNSKIRVADLPVPDGVQIIADPEILIALVEAPRAEEAPAAEPTVAEVKTEREIKKAEKEKAEEAAEE